MLEYSKRNWSTFVNVSGAMSQYKAEDYLFAKTIDIEGKTYYTSYATKTGDVPTRVANVNGTLYTVDSPGKITTDYAAAKGLKIDSTSAQNQVVGWINLPSVTFKTGASYKLDKEFSVFMNVGYISKAARFANVINATNSYNTTADIGKITTYSNYKNEIIKAIELGYQCRTRYFEIGRASCRERV